VVGRPVRLDRQVIPRWHCVRSRRLVDDGSHSYYFLFL
jgi:hypothetical protein